MAAGVERATVHLRVFGQQREFSFDVKVGPSTARDLLPTATELSRQISVAATEDAERQGKQVSCRAGCDACCRHLIPISIIEAAALAELVAKLPAERREEVRARFAAALRQMEGAGLLDPNAPRGERPLRSTAAAGGSTWDDVSRRYFAAHIDCPFLEAGSCTIYADRPLICREYQVTTPAAWCSDFEARIEGIARPVRMSESLADAADELSGEKRPSVPLAQALEWAETHPGALAGETDGEAMFWVLLRQVDAQTKTPPEKR